MGQWRIRDFVPNDLEAVVRLDAENSPAEQPAVFRLSEVIGALRAPHPAVVAVVNGAVIGAAISRVDGNRAWVLRICLDGDWRDLGLGSELLAVLERRLLAEGVHTLAAVLPTGQTGAAALVNSGFSRREGLDYFEKADMVTAHEVGVLASLGAVPPARGAWERLAGMAAEKTLIERRLVLPLSQPELAAQHGVEPPRAVVLFGPPGTGKSTFARAVASRLNWPFVELLPSRLALEEGMAAGFARRFAEVAQLEQIVVFIDEVEEVATARDGDSHLSVGVVNELLKAIVTFRERADRLLVCATNDVSVLDPAFLRHGRFDYVLPVGPPDRTARRALWESYLAKAEADVDMEALAGASEGFTPADIAQAARAVAQAVFERTLDTGERSRPTTQEYLATIRRTRPTVTTAMARRFEDQTEQFART